MVHFLKVHHDYLFQQFCHVPIRILDDLFGDYSEFSLIIINSAVLFEEYETIKMIKQYLDIPVIVIFSKEREEEMINFINAGVDDFVLKPNIKELIIRIQLHLNNNKCCYSEIQKRIMADNKLIKLEKLKVIINDSSFFLLTKKEYNIVNLLSNDSNKVFSAEEIYELVYPISTDTQIRSISEYIYQIRYKFKKYGINPILTVWGGGYSWKN